MIDHDPRTIVVVGGGITGLAAAFEAAKRGARVTVLEAGDRFGGKIWSPEFEGRPVDAASDMFLARVPWALDLVGELGLSDELISPATSAAWIWARGRARRLPQGLVLGVPTSIPAVARSGILSPLALARAGLDLVRPRFPRADADDIAVGALIRHRFGSAVNGYLVDPLLGGINAGHTDTLSLGAAVPQLVEALTTNRSLLVGLRGQQATNPPDPSRPVFHSLRGGMGRLVDALVDRLRSLGVELRSETAIDDLSALDPADGVVLALPAHAAVPLLASQAPRAAELLGTIDAASVAVVIADYERSAVPGALEGSGLLVPSPEGRQISAVSWTSSKWPTVARDGRATLRISMGRDGNDDVVDLTDDALLRVVVAELHDLMGIVDEPMASRVVRWPRAFPQYRPGHLRLVAEIERAVAESVPHVRVAGASYRGLGIPACIRQGRAAAASLLPS